MILVEEMACHLTNFLEHRRIIEAADTYLMINLGFDLKIDQEN